MEKLAVVILNWNGKSWLERFLENVVNRSSPYQVYIIDNCSSDGSLEYLQDYFPLVKVVKLDKNYGFAAGYNVGLENVKAQYCVLLNSDVEVTDNWISPILSLMESDISIAAVQPKILDLKQPERFEYAGASGGFIDTFGVPFCRGRIFEWLENDVAQYDSRLQVFWASGAAFFVRMEYFWQAGGFDVDFFAHMEEIDLCWRLQNLGFKIICEPASKVYHFGGGTLNKMNSRKYYLNFRNSLWMIFKNQSSNKLIFSMLGRMILDGVGAVKFAIDGRPIMLWVVLKAHLVFYFSIFRLIKKRKMINQGLPFDTIYNRSIVIDHFLNKKKIFGTLKFNIKNL